MNDWLYVTLPYDTKLSKNNKFAGAINRRFVQSTTYQRAKASVISQLKKALKENPVTFEAKQKVVIAAMFYRPDFKSDIQNLQEALCDCISKVIKVDDRYFSFDRWDWHLDRENPRIILVIKKGLPDNILE